MTTQDIACLSAIIRTRLFTPLEISRLLEYFTLPFSLYSAKNNDLLNCGLKPDKAAKFMSAMRFLPMETELVNLDKHDISVVPKGSTFYPPLLNEIPDAPPILYVRGHLEALSGPLPLSVVGSRKMSTYGHAALNLLVSPAAAASATIISGLALGCDAAAHRAALDAHGLTIAVLASGVDRSCVGPHANFGLSEEIISSGGCLVSEYPPGIHADKSTFPARNRIIAGLAKAVLVVEAAERSGTLITARLALDYNRELLAVPGPITSQFSTGSNRLLAQGARPALVPEDIFEELRGLRSMAYTPKPTEPTQAAIISALESGPATIDQIIDRTGLEPRAVIAAACTLEADGFVFNTGDFYHLSATIN